MYSHETSVYHAIIITVVAIGFILVYIGYSFVRQHRNNTALRRKHFIDEIKLLDTDRSRVSRDIHDDAGTIISLVQVHLHEVAEEERMHLEKAQELLDELTKRLRRIAMNLSPAPLVRKGLLYTLNDFFEQIEGSFPLSIQFIYEAKREIPMEARIHLYRIVQEITHNAVKHSKAGKLKVHFRERGKALYLLCKDDGTGFDTKKAQEQRCGLGLSTIKSRTEILGGKISCISNAQHGTEYFFAFPFERTGKDH